MISFSVRGFSVAITMIGHSSLLKNLPCSTCASHLFLLSFLDPSRPRVSLRAIFFFLASRTKSFHPSSVMLSRMTSLEAVSKCVQNSTGGDCSVPPTAMPFAIQQCLGSVGIFRFNCSE